MAVVPEELCFEWDLGNSQKNYQKHRVNIQEAEEVFSNEPFIISTDHDHSQIEKRYRALGKTNDQRKLFLVFTIRNKAIRVISVRDMSKKEVQIYEEAQTNT